MPDTPDIPAVDTQATTTAAIDNSAKAPYILVDFGTSAGVQQVSRSPQDLAEKSEEAVERAMVTIRMMGQRVREAVDGMAFKPSSVEVQFGIKLDVSAGALITKAGVQADLNVKLGWASDSAS